jgi:hypothetical protein
MSARGEAAVDQAQNFSGGQISAARRRERWQLAEANAGDEESREQFREAIADLEARYPEIAELEPGEAESYARTRGHGSGSRSPVHGGRSRKRPGTRTQTSTKPSSGSGGDKSRDRAATRRPSRRRAGPKSRASTPRVDRAVEQTGIPAATRSSGNLILTLLGYTVGLSLLYLVFHSAETPGAGAKAVPSIVQGTVKAIGRFISLADVFPGAPAAATSAGTPTTTPPYGVASPRFSHTPYGVTGHGTGTGQSHVHR